MEIYSRYHDLHYFFRNIAKLSLSVRHDKKDINQPYLSNLIPVATGEFQTDNLKISH